MNERKAFHWVRGVFFIVLSIVIVFSLMSMNEFWHEKSSEQPEKIVQAIKRACVQCYAIEGSYPPNIDYLSKHYGIILDHDNYFYYYEAFASNLMPYVEVYEKKH